MNLATNTFKAAINQSKPQIGLWNSLCSNFAADVVSSTGFDWALLDMEHSPNDVQTVLGQM
ncbi:MAG: aldolase/citrate lyase family protein, partial [Pseudomonadota bacterium]